MRVRPSAAMIGILGATLIASGCEILAPDTTTILLDVVLRNAASDGQPIHILKPGEGFAPSNQIAPGGSRFVDVGVPGNGEVEFRAGRNGQVLADATCITQDRWAQRDSGIPGRVIWNGSALTCADWDS